MATDRAALYSKKNGCVPYSNGRAPYTDDSKCPRPCNSDNTKANPPFAHKTANPKDMYGPMYPPQNAQVDAPHNNKSSREIAGVLGHYRFNWIDVVFIAPNGRTSNVGWKLLVKVVREVPELSYYVGKRLSEVVKPNDIVYWSGEVAEIMLSHLRKGGHLEDVGTPICISHPKVQKQRLVVRRDVEFYGVDGDHVSWAFMSRGISRKVVFHCLLRMKHMAEIVNSSDDGTPIEERLKAKFAKYEADQAHYTKKIKTLLNLDPDEWWPEKIRVLRTFVLSEFYEHVQKFIDRFGNEMAAKLLETPGFAGWLYYVGATRVFEVIDLLDGYFSSEGGSSTLLSSPGFLGHFLKKKNATVDIFNFISLFNSLSDCFDSAKERVSLLKTDGLLGHTKKIGNEQFLEYVKGLCAVFGSSTARALLSTCGFVFWMLKVEKEVFFDNLDGMVDEFGLKHTVRLVRGGGAVPRPLFPMYEPSE